MDKILIFLMRFNLFSVKDIGKKKKIEVTDVQTCMKALGSAATKFQLGNEKF